MTKENKKKARMKSQDLEKSMDYLEKRENRDHTEWLLEISAFSI